LEDTPVGTQSATNAGVRVIALPSSSTVSCEFPTAQLIIKPGEKKSVRDILERLM